jgi:polar amino acid transport system substrate-binding protein
MQHLRRSILISSLGLGFGFGANGEPASSTKQASRVNRLIIAYNDDYAPYSFVEENVVKGILPDVLSHLLESVPSLEVQHIGLPWRRVQLEVQNAKSDAFCTFASEERQQYAFFHKVPVVVLQPHLFFAASSPLRKTIERVSTRAELMELRLIDQSGNQWAEQNLKDFPKIEYVPGHDNVFKMILIGRGDVHVSLSPVVTRWRMRKLGLPMNEIMAVPAPYIASQVPFHLLIGKHHPRAAEILKHVDVVLSRAATAKAIERITSRF